MTSSRKRASSGSRTELPDVETAARAPSASERASATRVVLNDEQAGSVVAVMSALPEPTTLAPGGLVLVPAEVVPRTKSLARSVLSAFVKPKAASRAHRCSALVARGYIAVGAAHDEQGADLAWGYAPRAAQDE